jgi:ABC-type sulfate transport system permease subunit
VRNRSVIELLVLILTIVIGLTMVGAGLTIAIIKIRDPEADTSQAGTVLVNLISTTLGALLGLIAGRSAFTRDLGRRPDEDDE